MIAAVHEEAQSTVFALERRRTNGGEWIAAPPCGLRGPELAFWEARWEARWDMHGEFAWLGPSKGALELFVNIL